MCAGEKKPRWREDGWEGPGAFPVIGPSSQSSAQGQGLPHCPGILMRNMHLREVEPLGKVAQLICGTLESTNCSLSAPSLQLRKQIQRGKRRVRGHVMSVSGTSYHWAEVD